MGWATEYINELRKGRTVRFRPTGNSMQPLIQSGQLVEVAPTSGGHLKIGDIVLCRVGKAEYLHLIKDIDFDEEFGSFRVQIGNNKGRINGWIDASNVFGKLTEVF